MSDIKTLAQDTQRRNNIDLLRFILAAMVALFHIRVLSGSDELGRLLRFANGRYAVLGFFAISGYVVSLSWLRTGSRRVYVQRRLRRIVPGYLAVVAFCWIAGSAVSQLSLAEYWRDPGTWRYLAANLSFLQFLGPSLPGVFAANPVMNAVNGSLWSIRAELFCYALVPLLGRFRWRAAAAAAACIVLLILVPHWTAPSMAEALSVGVLEPVICFLIGALAAREPRRRRLFASAAVALLAMLASPFQTMILESLGVACVVLAAALAPVYLGRWTALGNVSYGMYLWHFPVIQWLCGQNWAVRAPMLFLAAAVTLTLAFGALSWNIVEKRFLASRQSWTGAEGLEAATLSLEGR